MVEPIRPMPRGEHARGVPYRIIRAMFVVVFFWVFWKFGGYIITALVVRRFGSGATSDAYFFATQAVVYGLIFAPAMAVLVPAFMPVFIEERNRGGEAAARSFARTVLTVVLLGCAVVLAGGYAFARPITSTLVPGFGPEACDLGVSLLHWMLPGVAAMVVFLLFRALLNSYKVFSYPSAAEALQKLVWVAVFVATAWAVGIRAAVLGFLAGSAVMLAVAAVGLRNRRDLLAPAIGAMSRTAFLREVLTVLAFLAVGGGAVLGTARLLPEGLADYRGLVVMTVVLALVLAYSLLLLVRSRGRTGPMARLAVLAVPLAISTFFASYRNVVTFYFQSYTATGVFSDIEGARKIVNFPTELVALALAVAMLPYLCELASRRNHAALGDIVTKSLRLLAVGFVPLTVMTLVLAEPIVRLVLDRGDRDPEHIHCTVVALQAFGVALYFYAAERVLMQAYFSLQRMWTPALLGIAATVFQVLFLAVPFYALGLGQEEVFPYVILAYPVSRILKNIVLLLLLKRHLPVLPARATLAFAAKLTVTCLAAGAAAWWTLGATERAVDDEPYRVRKAMLLTPQESAEAVRDSVSPAAGLDASGLTRLRCYANVTDGPGARGLTIAVTTDRGEGSYTASVEPGQRRQIEFGPRDASLDSDDWQGLRAVSWTFASGRGTARVDEVSLRRPPQPMRYMVVMLLHCGLPTAVGCVVMLAGLVLLRFDELKQVLTWVKDRGWRKVRTGAEEAGYGAGEGQ